MKSNNISKAKRMKVTWLVGGSHGEPGCVMDAYKDEQGWHGTDEKGTTWALFDSHLRNPDICQVEVIE